MFTYAHLYIHEFLFVEIGFLLKEVEPKTLLWDFKFSQQDSMSSTVDTQGLPIFLISHSIWQKMDNLRLLNKNFDLSNNSGSFSVCSVVKNVNRLSEQIDNTDRHPNDYKLRTSLSEKIFYILWKVYCFFGKQFCFHEKSSKKLFPICLFSRLSRLLCCCLLLSSRVFPIQTTKNFRK